MITNFMVDVLFIGVIYAGTNEEVQTPINHANAINHSTSGASNGDIDVNLMPKACGVSKQASAEKPFEHTPMQKTVSELRDKQFANSAQIQPLHMQCQMPKVLTPELPTEHQSPGIQLDIENQTDATGEEAANYKALSTNNPQEHFTHDIVDALRQLTDKTVEQLSTEMHKGFQKQVELFKVLMKKTAVEPLTSIEEPDEQNEHTKESESKSQANYEKELKKMNDEIATIQNKLDELVGNGELTRIAQENHMKALLKMQEMMEIQIGEQKMLRQEVQQLTKQVTTVLHIDEN